MGSARTPSLRVLIGAAAVLTAAGGTGAAFVAVLLTNAPLVLIAVSPLYRHLVLTATVVDFAPFALVAVPARLLGSVVGYMWGLGYGERSLLWVEQRRPRWGRWLRVLERWFERAASPLLLAWPGPMFSAFAGAAGMPVWQFGLLATVGQFIQVTVAYWVGKRLAPWLDPIVVFFREYMLWATLGCVALAVLYHYATRSRLSMLAAAEVASSERPGDRG